MALPKPTLPQVITRFEDVERLVTVYRQRGTSVSFDIETTNLDPRQGKLVMLQFQQQGRPVVVVDYRYLIYYSGTQVDGDGLRYLGDILDKLFDGSVLIVGHNLKFDLGYMRAQVGVTAKRIYDTMLAELVIHGLGSKDARNAGMSMSLEATAARYGFTMSKEERKWFYDLDQRPEWNQPFPAEQLQYGARDVEVLQQIMVEQQAKLKERNLLHVAKLEMRTLPALVEVEHAGVRVDVAGWRAFIAEKTVEAAQAEDEAILTFGPPIMEARAEEYDLELMMWEAWDAARITKEADLRDIWSVGHDTGYPTWGKFKIANMKLWRDRNPNPGKPKHDMSLPNLGSPQQLMVAFTRLGIPIPTKRNPKTGVSKPSTGSEALKSLEDEHPQVKPLIEWRKAIKFVTAFGEALLKFVDPGTGRIHPEYNQIGTSTGRMSCTRPNWQQVPSKGDGAKLRALVKAEPGNVILTADFSNIELRILADMSGDARMLESFSQGIDLHAYTAKMMFNLGDDVNVKHEYAFPGVTYRAVAKTINFGLVYGMSATKLARTLSITREAAAELMEVYFSLYPGVQKWLAEQRQSGTDHMMSLTYAGRKRYYKLPAEPPRPMTRDVAEINAWQEAVRSWKGLRHQIERQACNSPVQGTCGDILKLALCLLHESLYGDKYLRDVCRTIALVHDEMVLEVPEQLADRAARVLAESMQAAASTYLKTVTLPPVEVAVSDHWSKE